ncbi:MAG: adenylyl-sulfate kinase, partial [Anaerolineales bacterium]
QFIEVFVDAPQDVCERRDTKGLYLKARRGEIRGFTGIDDPYEPPANAEIVLDAENLSPETSSHRILEYLREQAFLKE